MTQQASTWRCRSQLTASMTALRPVKHSMSHARTQCDLMQLHDVCVAQGRACASVSDGCSVSNSRKQATCTAVAVTDHQQGGMQQGEPSPRFHVAVGPAGAQPCIQVGRCDEMFEGSSTSRADAAELLIQSKMLLQRVSEGCARQHSGSHRLDTSAADCPMANSDDSGGRVPLAGSPAVRCHHGPLDGGSAQPQAARGRAARRHLQQHDPQQQCCSGSGIR
jgi:hypothetical protein